MCCVYADELWLQHVGSVIDIFFIIDLMLNFFTTYEDDMKVTSTTLHAICTQSPAPCHPTRNLHAITSHPSSHPAIPAAILSVGCVLNVPMCVAGECDRLPANSVQLPAGMVHD